MSKEASTSLGEVFRILSLGIVNIIGIIVPGLLFVILLILSVVSAYIYVNDIFPQFQLSLGLCPLFGLYDLDGKLIVILVLIISYVLGYVLRLGDIDFLDGKSEKHVWKKMAKERNKRQQQAAHEQPQEKSTEHGLKLLNERCKNAWHILTAPFKKYDKERQQKAAEEDNWPCWPNDTCSRYPYLHMWSYLKARGLKDEAAIVLWQSTQQKGESPQRSKAIINGYKLEVLKNAPDLSAVIESNEAHIRLLFGVWQVARTFYVFSFILGVFSLVTAILLYFGVLKQPFAAAPSCAIIGCVQLLITIMLVYVKTRIVQLFHYQRVRELTWILACTRLAKINQ